MKFKVIKRPESEMINDPLLKLVAAALKKKGEGTSVLSPKRMAELNKVYKVITNIADRKNTKVECGINEPFVGSGYISIVCDKIVFDDPKALEEIIKLSDIMEVYPRKDHKISIDFAFDDISIKIGD
ncbi:MAG: hypothetical protein ACI4RN_07780 [Oscillospiraceae bacterium]